ncbi:MAG TPA: MFS transporter [Jatrophihabitans sp.]|nr:MFS transporter [Jatrophihabitans sp.]
MPAAYRRLQLATAVDSIGDGAFAAAMPLLAVTITHDPRLVSVVSAATFLPWLLLSLPLGALVDRRERISLMWRSQVVQALAVMVIAVLAAFGEAGIGALAALAFAMGGCEVLFGITAQSVLPDLVPKDQLHRANGQQYAVMTAAQLFIGPPLGSLLFGIGIALPFGADAASFAISAALLATLPRIRREPTTHPPLRTSIGEGVHWLAGNRLLRTLALLLGVNNFCGQFGNATLVLLATQVLHVSARGYGVLLAGAAIGAVVGGLVNATVVRWLGETRALLTAMAGMAATYLGMGLSTDLVELGAFMAVNGFLVTLWNIVTVTFRQQLVPPELLGRVNSVYRMIGWGLMPLGAIAGGYVARWLGLRAPYVVAAGLRISVFVLAVPVLLAALRLAQCRTDAVGLPHAEPDPPGRVVRR